MMNEQQTRKIDLALTSRYLDGQLRNLLDLPDPDDEMRDIREGLDIECQFRGTCTWEVLISSYSADGKPIMIYPYFAEILHAVGHLSTIIVPTGLEFFECDAVTPYHVKIRIIINSESEYDSWRHKYFGELD